MSVISGADGQSGEKSTMSEQELGRIDPVVATTTATPRGRKPIERALYGDVIQFAEFIVITVLSILVAYIYHIEVLIIEFDLQLYASAGIIGATGVTALLRRDGFYEFEQLISSSRAIRAILTRWIVVILALIAFAFTLKISDTFSRVWLFTWAGASTFILVTGRVFAAQYLRRAARAGGVFGRRVAVIGSSKACSTFEEHADRSHMAISVVGRFDCEDLDNGNSSAVREIGALETLARAGDVDDIVIAARNMSSGDMAELISRLSALPVSVAILSSMHWLDHLGGEIIRIGEAPALRLYRRPLEGWGGIVKNLEDRVLGLLIFLAALPVMLAIAAILSLQGGGPILFSQKRHGFNQEVFKIYKFRSMSVAEDGDVVTQARKGDVRVTKIGSFLRKWSLDELPQLLNVLKGEMSLIGPRPHALAHNNEYAKIIENYSGRHKVKPGITGWAQVNGFRGETSETEQMENRVRFDLEYIDNWSLWFDMKILVLTVVAVLFPKNAY